MAAHIVPIMSTPAAAAPTLAPITEEVTTQMDKISIKPGFSATQAKPVAGTSVRITVPLDATARTTSSLYPDRKLLRRDSLERREALLKGKEGSRQRRRWENGTTGIP